MKEFTIFKSYNLYSLEELNLLEQDAKENLIENGIEEPTQEDILQEQYLMEETSYEDEQCNLNKTLNGNIIAIADVGRWDGRRTGYKILSNNLNQVLSFMKCDSINCYADQYNVRADLYHHDGVHHVEYRELREDTNYQVLLDKLYCQEPVSREEIRRYTKSLRPCIKQIYMG